MWSVAGSYAGPKSGGRSSGAAALVSCFSSEPLQETDAWGDVTERYITSTGMRVDVVATRQWRWGGLGLKWGRAWESFSGLTEGENPGRSAESRIGLGVLGKLGPVQVGFSHEFEQIPKRFSGMMRLDASVDIDVLGHSCLGGEVEGPFLLGSQSYEMSGGVGLSVEPHRSLAGHAAFRGGGTEAGLGGRTVTLGFTVRLRNVTVDYGVVTPLTFGLGTTHLISLGHEFGAAR